MAEQQYKLVVSAGPSYDVSTHQLVPVNLPDPINVKSELIESQVNVRIQKYRGLPTGAPETCEYFSQQPHAHDLYSISFSFKLPSGVEISGDNLLFGNDFDQPIRHNLPIGFNAALRMVRWTIDPGLDGDVYAEKPYLYGPLLSSMNTFYVESNSSKMSSTNESLEAAQDELVAEGGDEQGSHLRKEHSIPDDSAKRMKHFLDVQKRKEWIFDGGREYHCDFFNPYLDFNEFALKLPGLSIPMLRYWDGQPLRYVLKHRSKDASVDKELLVIMFNLVPEDDVDEEEAKWIKNGQAEAATKAVKKSNDDHDGTAIANKPDLGERKQQQAVDEDVD